MTERLAAILVADVVGYSKLIGSDEAVGGAVRAFRPRFSRYRRGARSRTLRRHHGGGEQT
jgi:hypothetical protein